MTFHLNQKFNQFGVALSVPVPNKRFPGMMLYEHVAALTAIALVLTDSFPFLVKQGAGSTDESIRSCLWGKQTLRDTKSKSRGFGIKVVDGGSSFVSPQKCIILDPFPPLLNVPQILKTRVQLQFWKICGWPI